jgi:hypothetical protein
MKRLSLLILVASALLLCAQSPSPQPSPVPKPRPRPTKSASPKVNHDNNAGDNNQRATTITVSTPGQSHPIPSKTPTSDSNAQIQRELITIEGKIADFTGWLVLVGLFQFLASVFAAYSASSSAKVARLALKVDRPYLILEHAQITGVLRGDDPIRKETPQPDELTIPPRFSPRVVLSFRNYGKGPVIFGEGIIRIDAFATLPPARDFSGCKRMGLQANAVRAGGIWRPLAQFNLEADWTALFPDIAAERKSLIAYGCVRYTDPIGKDTYETGFCWIFIPPRTEFQTMPKSVIELLGPYRSPGAPDPQTPIPIKMPGDFRRGPKTHNYCD